MTEQPQTKASFAAFLATTHGKLIIALTIVALLLGIAAEGVSLFTGYYNVIVARQDAAAATAQGAKPAPLHPKRPMTRPPVIATLAKLPMRVARGL
ncbi:MAG: hypothetical protein ACLP7P_09740 [Rhodomicrobium sp.]